MADKKISDFTATTTVADGDLFELENVAGNSRKITGANLKIYTRAGLAHAPAAANFGTCYAALRGGSTGNPATMSDDTDVGMAIYDASTDAPAVKLMGRAIPGAYQGATGDFDFQAQVRPVLLGGNDSQAGIWVGTAGGKYLLLGALQTSSSARLQRAYYNAGWNDGTFTSPLGIVQYYRIGVSNQTTTCYVSADGKIWTKLIAAENLFTAAYTLYGFYIGRYSTNEQNKSSSAWYSSSEFPA